MAYNKNNGLQLIESLETGEQKVYSSVFVDHKNVNILSNDLAIKIVAKLAESKGCAMDLARDLNQHEQKIYYYLRKLETAGVVKKVGTERRFGMIAKMYSAVSPIVATKLYDDGSILHNGSADKDPRLVKLLHPFIEGGNLNAKIIIGYPYPHGKYDSHANEAAHLFDFAVMLGKFIGKVDFPNYKFDVDMHESELKNNLILFGNQTTNTVLDKINEKLPLTLQKEPDGYVSKNSGKVYKEPNVGIVAKFNNPFAEGKKIFWVGGIRTRGTHAAIIAITQHLNNITLDKENFVAIVEGLDKNADHILDSIKVLEMGDFY